ncbi:hypothetical protein [Micromonospora sp. NPDC047074]|uniref:hypothetical protein n=1 Tax=Micromonospora sp. NPDC047074 TaxID=3154339 RepID=UPI0033C07B70
MHATSRLAGLAELTGVRKVWFSGWYDGPITGLAMHDGHEYWFIMVTDDEGGSWDFDPRVYVLHKLTSAQLLDAWEAHRGFAAAGLPGCLHSPRCAAASATDDPKLAALHERWPPEIEDAYLDAPAIGWFRGGARQDDQHSDH